MNDADRELFAQIVEFERKRMLAEPPVAPQPVEPQTIHFSELPEDTSGGRLSIEWNFYRREVGLLLAEGHEGRWVLIRGEEIVGIWDTQEEAERIRRDRFPLKDVFLKQIRTREPVIRGWGYFRRWR